MPKLQLLQFRTEAQIFRAAIQFLQQEKKILVRYILLPASLLYCLLFGFEFLVYGNFPTSMQALSENYWFYGVFTFSAWFIHSMLFVIGIQAVMLYAENRLNWPELRDDFPRLFLKSLIGTIVGGLGAWTITGWPVREEIIEVFPAETKWIPSLFIVLGGLFCLSFIFSSGNPLLITTYFSTPKIKQLFGGEFHHAIRFYTKNHYLSAFWVFLAPIVARWLIWIIMWYLSSTFVGEGIWMSLFCVVIKLGVNMLFLFTGVSLAIMLFSEMDSIRDLDLTHKIEQIGKEN